MGIGRTSTGENDDRAHLLLRDCEAMEEGISWGRVVKQERGRKRL